MTQTPPRRPRPTRITTSNYAAPEKTIDMSRVGDRKWLLSHLNWALAHGHEVIATPIQPQS